ncbi:unnamed protein product [Urochloa humidicola]
MTRRFVNLVLEYYGYGPYGSRMHSLHRLDVAKHLFYPSTAAAEAANANNNGGGGAAAAGKPKPAPRILRRRLPEPSMRFSPFPPAVDDEEEEEGGNLPKRITYGDSSFMLLSPSTSEGRILYATEHGRTVVYDADAGAISAAVPSFPKPMPRDPIAFSVPGSGGFMDKKESLYVMRSSISPPPPSPPNKRDPAGDFVVLDFNKPYEWQPLPPPPFAAATADLYSCSRYGGGSGSVTIKSSAVVDGGRTICVSTASSGAAKRTYCFDTAAREWRHAGDWALPFHGRAEHVPELGTWIGLSSWPQVHNTTSVPLTSPP